MTFLLKADSALSRPVSTVLLAAACLFPVGCRHPASWHDEPAYRAARLTGYDTNNNGRLDYLQGWTADGVKRWLYFAAGSGAELTPEALDAMELPEAGAAVPGFERVDQARLGEAPEARTLIFLLDGVSYELVEQVYNEGHFRLLHPPGRLIPTFPTMTDVIYAQFFEAVPPLGVQALYIDTEKMEQVGGQLFYLQGGNARQWPEHLLWRQSHFLDALVYVLPEWVSGRELDKSVGAALRWYDETDEPYACIYAVMIDALGHKLGHEAQKAFLRRVDTAIEKLIWHSGGRLRIVTMADHGLNSRDMKRAKVAEGLEAAGFRVRNKIESPDDVIVPAFGLISYVDIATHRPEAVACAATRIEGVDVAVYRTDDSTTVVHGSGGGKALIERRADGALRYQALTTDMDAPYDTPTVPDAANRPGEPVAVPLVYYDPLDLSEVMARMRREGRMDAEGWATPDAWLEATWNHAYPDPVTRLAEAFDGMAHPPTVLLSLAPEYYFGAGGFEGFASLQGTHGSLHTSATVSYAMSNFFVPPRYSRTKAFRDELKRRLGRETLLAPKP